MNPKCSKCGEVEIDKDAPIPYFDVKFDWAEKEFLLCENCIQDVLTNWMYAHLNKDGELI